MRAGSANVILNIIQMSLNESDWDACRLSFLKRDRNVVKMGNFMVSVGELQMMEKQILGGSSLNDDQRCLD